MNKDILVVYRCCPAETGGRPVKECRPEKFSKTKCFDTFINGIIEESRIDVVVLYDTKQSLDNDPLYNYILGISRYNKNIVSLLCIGCEDNNSSYLESIKTANYFINEKYINSNSKNYNFVYFVEDDYFHKENWDLYLIEGFKILKKYNDWKSTKGGEYLTPGIVSLYDHPDRYTRVDDQTAGLESILLTDLSHWRTAESTTCTWGTTKETFNEIYEDILRFGIKDREFFRHLYTMYGLRLITPIPGVATHLHLPFISPFFFDGT
jgi:hypothetical protein